MIRTLQRHELPAGRHSDTVLGLVVVSELTRSLGAMRPDKWLQVCCDTLVHAVNADAGAVVARGAMVVASTGISEAQLDTLSFGGALPASGEHQILAVVDLDPLASLSARLYVCCTPEGADYLDLDALLPLGDGLLRLVSVCADQAAEASQVS